MNTFLIGLYLEDEKRFEFDFARQLFKISFYKEKQPAGSIVSSFSIVRNENDIYLLIRNYGRLGERKIMIESVKDDKLVINDDNHIYNLQKVA